MHAFADNGSHLSTPAFLIALAVLTVAAVITLVAVELHERHQHRKDQQS